MKQLIGLVHFGALTALSVVLCSAHRETMATKSPDRQLPRPGDLVWLGLDGTILAREVNLAPQAG